MILNNMKLAGANTLLVMRSVNPKFCQGQQICFNHTGASWWESYEDKNTAYKRKKNSFTKLLDIIKWLRFLLLETVPATTSVCTSFTGKIKSGESGERQEKV